MPGDRLAFAIGVGREIEVTGVLDRFCDIGDPLFFVGERLVDHPEIFIRQDRAILFRQIADMTIAGEHLIISAQIFVDGFGFGR